MIFTQPTGFGILWEPDNFDFFDCIVFFKMASLQKYPTMLFPNKLLCVWVFIDCFFYFESGLKINFEVKNFESATMQFYEWIKNKICEWLLFGFSYLNILFFVSDLSFFVNFVTVLFLPDKRYMYLILWLIWRRVWYHILRVYFLHSLFQLYLINTFPIKKKYFSWTWN